ncbi:MAG: tetratricopeptide repeat protein [Candidatus Omnitrophota bacterium]|nr:tetratricopeptide repeat protein [Candidatus Omnitrophota bacterium]
MLKKIGFFTILLSISCIYFLSSLFAAIITLKSGKKVEGKIIEKTDKYIKIDFEGVPLTYFLEDIESVDGVKQIPSISEAKVKMSSQKTINTLASENKVQRELKTMEDVAQWSTLYYQEPTVDNVIPALKIILEDKRILSDIDRAGSQIHLFAAILQNDKTKIAQVKDIAQQYTGNAKEFLLRVVQEAESFKSPYPKDPNDLDCLWGEFFATGSVEPIKKIISVLLYTEEDIDLSSLVWRKDGWTSKAQALFTLKHVAEWSLNSNAKQHKKVHDIIAQEGESTDNKFLKERLKVILEGISSTPVSNSYAKRPEDEALAMGIGYARQGRHEQAISEFSKAIGLKPNFVEAYINRGMAYGKQRQLRPGNLRLHQGHSTQS